VADEHRTAILACSLTALEGVTIWAMAVNDEQPSPLGSHQFLDKLALAYHREIAARLLTDSEAVLDRARRNLRRWLAAHEPGSAEARCLEEWQRLLETRSVDELVAIITEDSDEGQRLRSSTPFTGILSLQERKELRARCEEESIA
jgi:hypothetical protein